MVGNGSRCYFESCRFDTYEVLSWFTDRFTFLAKNWVSYLMEFIVFESYLFCNSISRIVNLAGF